VTVTHPTPNQSQRRKQIRVIVLHATAGRTDRGDVSWVQSPAAKASYHVLIGRDGRRYVCVADTKRAWHAGVSTWEGVHNVNDFSLGLAWCNRHDGTERLTPQQVAAAQEVVREWVATYPTITAIVTHKEIATSRKSDPHYIPNFVRSEWQVAQFRP